MFIDELTPIFKELAKQPVAFASGFFTGLFRLKLTEDPLQSWLEQQGVYRYSAPGENNPGNGSGPQSISIE